MNRELQSEPKKRRRKKLKHAEMTQSTPMVHCMKDGLELRGAIVALSESGAAGLEDRLAPVLEAGETMPDVGLLFRLMGRLAESELEAAYEAEAQHWQAGLTLLGLRQRCRDAKDELYAATVRVRKILVELFGSAYTRLRFGLRKRTPRGTADLMLEAGGIERRLRNPETPLPQPSTPGLTIAPLAWAKLLRPGVELVERLLHEVEAARIKVSDLAGERDRRLASFRSTYLEVARSVEALFVLAGRPDLAKSVRSSARWRQRMAEARRQRRREAVAKVARASLEMPAKALGRLRSAVASVGGWLRLVDPVRSADSEKPGDFAVAARAAAAGNP
jgi:hypothetical protein